MAVRCLQPDDVNLLALPDEAEIHKAEHLVQGKLSNLSDLSMVIRVDLRYEARGMVYTGQAHELVV
jgi:hypothetical protein